MNLKMSRWILKINGILALLCGAFRSVLGVTGTIGFRLLAGKTADVTLFSVIFSGAAVWSISGIIGMTDRMVPG